MRISISVPTPCHENWNAMTPAGTGRHCDKCQHTVMDLTQASDRQLIDLFRADAMPKCARFTQGQLDRVIALEERSARLMPAAALGAAMAFGAPGADAQNCTPTLGKMAVAQPADVLQVGQMMVAPLKDHASEDSERGNMAITGDTIATEIDLHETGEVEIRGGRVAVEPHSAPPPISAIEEVQVITGGPIDFFAAPHGLFVVEPRDTITGRVIDHAGSPIPFANVRVRGTELQAVTDQEGEYLVTLPRSISSAGGTLIISFVGFSAREVVVPAFGEAQRHEACPYNDKAPLTGRVTWADGKAASHVEVELIELGLRCTTDTHGYFSFDHPVSDEISITLVAIDAQGAKGRARTDVGALPCCVSIALPGTGPADEVHATHLRLGDAIMQEAELMILGEFAIEDVPRDTLLTRATRPFRWMGEQIGKALR
ncbi:MAG: carboxypeptidase-like regulatory domain-containing protein [Flavobacteriales bacterium]|nr:carboxypeptidase-like regulatory domain-containing protein [Flavobacteriales bacterium]